MIRLILSVLFVIIVAILFSVSIFLAESQALPNLLRLGEKYKVLAMRLRCGQEQALELEQSQVQRLMLSL